MDNPEKLANKRSRIPNGQSKMDNPEKLATYGTQEKEKKQKTQHNMCWTPLCANKRRPVNGLASEHSHLFHL